MTRERLGRSSGNKITPLPRRIRNLLRYYIECAKEDDGIPLRIPLRDSGRRFITWPFEGDISCLDEDERRITLHSSQFPFAEELRRAYGRGSLLYGYPLYVESRNQTRYAIPVFTWQLEFEQNGRELWLRGVDDWPQMNPIYLRILAPTPEDQHRVLNALGLLDTSDDPPHRLVFDIVDRLQQLGLVREAVDSLEPQKLSNFRQVSPNIAIGTFNCAMLFAVERPMFTDGLVRDLGEIVESHAPGWQATALGHLFGVHSSDDTAQEEERAVVEAVPLNEEQREAVQMAASAPLTAVTGPPGTGKSQIVVGMIADSYLSGERVLFTSKNNKAVDVVEERVNALATNPLMIRTGSRAGARNFRQELVQRLAGMLAAQPTQDDRQRFDQLDERYDELLDQEDDLFEELRTIRLAHERLSPLRDARDRFEREYSLHQWKGLLECEGLPDTEELATALQVVDRHVSSSRGLLDRVSRMISASKDQERIQNVATEAVARCPALPPHPQDLQSFHGWRTWFVRAQSMGEALNAIARYRSGLSEIREMRSRDEVARQLQRVRSEVTDIGAELVALYARLVSDRLEPAHRRAIGNFRALIEELSGPQLSGRAYQENRRNMARLFPDVSRHIPAWCVTNLSARRSLPLEPNLFDLLIIDEASQCDIASALPLLYRSKRAVVIGDTQQLRHITRIGGRRDQQLQTKHGLGIDDQIFAYRVNSLFELSTSLESIGGLVQLRDHHRSHSDIVGYSNRRWYGGNLRVWTDYRRLKVPPDGKCGIRWSNVRGTATRPRGGSLIINEEASLVVQQVSELLVMQGFGGTVGIVTPFRAQANVIQEQIAASVGPDLLNRAQLIVNTAHGFQGDERDIVLFSPCVSTNLPSGSANFLRDTGNLFNVAVTRARSLLHVVGDMDACANSGIPHIEEFAAYCAEIERDASSPYSTTLARDERIGPEERPLYEALVQVGLNPLPQHPVNQYRLDLAIVLGDLRIAIEVDGVSTHADSLTDIERDERLENLGWRVLRFWNYQVKDDIDFCVNRVLREIETDEQEVTPLN